VEAGRADGEPLGEELHVAVLGLDDEGALASILGFGRREESGADETAGGDRVAAVGLHPDEQALGTEQDSLPQRAAPEVRARPEGTDHPAQQQQGNGPEGEEDAAHDQDRRPAVAHRVEPPGPKEHEHQRAHAPEHPAHSEEGEDVGSEVDRPRQQTHSGRERGRAVDPGPIGLGQPPVGDGAHVWEGTLQQRPPAV
jgi:hypothetical protein